MPDASMKILHVVRQFHPSVGGMESVVTALCDRLRRRGHQCEVVTLRRLWNDSRPLPPTEVVDDLRVVRIPFVGGRRYFLAPEVLRFAAGRTIIHVHGIDFFIDFLAATKWRHRTPLVASTHGGIFHTTWAMMAKRVYFHTITRLALAQAARVICDSAQDDRLFAPIVPAWKRVTISNGVEDAFFNIRKSVAPGLMVLVGRVAEHKGIDRMIDLLPRIRQQVPGARLTVVGPDWEGLRGSLEARARARGLADTVSFAGAVDRAALMAYLARAHLVLAPSAFEGFGIAVIEAMASGSLVVANDIEAHRELIQRSQNGILVDFADEERAVQTVVDVLRLSNDQAAAMGERARAAVSRFAWDRVVDRVERIYHESVTGGDQH
jgi:alpha-1,3-mannosyltransferase